MDVPGRSRVQGEDRFSSEAHCGCFEWAVLDVRMDYNYIGMYFKFRSLLLYLNFRRLNFGCTSRPSRSLLAEIIVAFRAMNVIPVAV